MVYRWCGDHAALGSSTCAGFAECHMNGERELVRYSRHGAEVGAMPLPGRVLDLIAEIWATVPLDSLDLPQTRFLGDTLGGRVAKPDHAHESR
jgi:hypothetical protein